MNAEQILRLKDKLPKVSNDNMLRLINGDLRDIGRHILAYNPDFIYFSGSKKSLSQITFMYRDPSRYSFELTKKHYLGDIEIPELPNSEEFIEGQAMYCIRSDYTITVSYLLCSGSYCCDGIGAFHSFSNAEKYLEALKKLISDNTITEES